jgi:hypothetical protein
MSYVFDPIFSSRICGLKYCRKKSIEIFTRRKTMSYVFDPIFSSRICGLKYCRKKSIEIFTRRKTMSYVFDPIFSSRIRGLKYCRKKSITNFTKRNDKATFSIQYFVSEFVATKNFTKIERKNCEPRSRSHFFVPYSC